MLGNRKLILDTWCEVYDQLKPWADGEFWDFQSHELVENAVYLIGRKQFTDNVKRIRQIVEDNLACIILSNPAEGSETLLGQCIALGVADLIKQGRILLIGGGDMDSDWPCLQYDSFLPKIFDYSENIAASQRINEVYQKQNKPYKFLFLNGRARPHRKYLLERFHNSGLLDQSIWTNLDSGYTKSRGLKLKGSPIPARLLDPMYEFDFYQDRIGLPTTDLFVKNHLFNNTWGEIYIRAEPYIDSYFSLVTETVFSYPHSFRTEKIWKPVAIGHPFIAVSNTGYYRDLHQLGFKTFGHLIDESFDSISNDQDRIERIAQVVEDLCQQDLDSFLQSVKDVCVYNQQHLGEMRTKVRQEFPARFFEFIKTRF